MTTFVLILLIVISWFAIGFLCSITENYLNYVSSDKETMTIEELLNGALGFSWLGIIPIILFVIFLLLKLKENITNAEVMKKVLFRKNN